jgi:hypothetical protein
MEKRNGKEEWERGMEKKIVKNRRDIFRNFCFHNHFFYMDFENDLFFALFTSLLYTMNESKKYIKLK